MRWFIPYGFGLLLWLPGKLTAQHVLYAEALRHSPTSHFRVIGKSENFYWVERKNDGKWNARHDNTGTNDNLHFELLDSKLHWLTEYPATRLPGTLKQWLVSGKESLDQITVAEANGKTYIFCSQFPTDGSRITRIRMMDSLSFPADVSGLLLIRSEDQSKILLTAFENTDSVTRVHALLFQADWQLIYHKIISHEQFAQPCIQDDDIGFPGESFDNLPIKLADNGEWMMTAPSRISCNFSIFHANATGNKYFFHELPLSPFYKMEDIAMSISNERQEMSVGLLSAYSGSSLKNVQVFNYSMRNGRIDFDSSYHFNTQYRDTRSKNLYHESFSAVPGAGFLLMMEYGKPYEFSKPTVPELNYWETAFLLSHYSETDNENQPLPGAYTKNSGLSPIALVRNPGDLNLFYFPAISKDSVWSGILETEQHTALNNPDLSYLMVPAGNKLYMIYNQSGEFTDPIATATTLNKQGQATDAPMIFWQLQRMLNFQTAHRFSSVEISVPFAGKQPDGFAIIKLE